MYVDSSFFRASALGCRHACNTGLKTSFAPDRPGVVRAKKGSVRGCCWTGPGEAAGHGPAFLFFVWSLRQEVGGQSFGRKKPAGRPPSPALLLTQCLLKPTEEKRRDGSTPSLRKMDVRM